DNIATPGLDVKELFFRVGSEVIAKTNGKQRPEISMSFYETYSLVPSTNLSTAASIQAAGPIPPLRHDDAAQAWAVTKDTTSIAVLAEFIRVYGDTVYGGMARARLGELQRATAAGPCGGGAMTVSFRAREPCPLAFGEERSLKPKDSFKECSHCPEMVVIP